MTHWRIPDKVGELCRWLEELDAGELDEFISDAEYLTADAYLPADKGEQQLVVATILGAARQLRDHGIDPLVTLRNSAPEGFYEAAGPPA